MCNFLLAVKGERKKSHLSLLSGAQLPFYPLCIHCGPPTLDPVMKQFCSVYRALKLKACSCLPRWREPRLSSYCFSSLLSGRARLFSRETPADERRIKENEGRKEDDFPEFWDIYSAEFGKGKLFLYRLSKFRGRIPRILHRLDPGRRMQRDNEI